MIAFLCRLWFPIGTHVERSSGPHVEPDLQAEILLWRSEPRVEPEIRAEWSSEPHVEPHVERSWSSDPHVVREILLCWISLNFPQVFHEQGDLHEQSVGAFLLRQEL